MACDATALSGQEVVQSSDAVAGRRPNERPWLVVGVSFRHGRVGPSWVKVVPVVLLTGVVFVLLPVMDWLINDSAGCAVIAAGGLLATVISLMLWRRREHDPH